MTIMKKSPSSRRISRRKEVTHERIVEVAARAIRRSGYNGTGVADIMKEAGLTHGGFYAHFASREAMLAEAADRAGAEAVATGSGEFHNGLRHRRSAAGRRGQAGARRTDRHRWQ